MCVCVHAHYGLVLLEGMVWGLNCQLTSLVFFNLFHSRPTTPLSLYLLPLSTRPQERRDTAEMQWHPWLWVSKADTRKLPGHEHKEELRETGGDRGRWGRQREMMREAG